MTNPHPNRDPLFKLLCTHCEGFNTIVGDVVVIALEDSRLLSASNLSIRLGEALEFAGAGELHDTLLHQGVYYVIFDCEALATGLAVLKAGLEQLELLETARIFHASIGSQDFEIHWPERPASADPFALCNVDPEFQAGLEKYAGLKSVCVVLAAGPGSTVWQDSDIAQSLDDALQAAHGGAKDSTLFSNNRYWIFFHCPDEAKALLVLKAALNERELLNHAQILVAEPTEKKWQVWFPPASGGAMI